MMEFFRKLLEALESKDLRHFFVRSYNLFCADYIKTPEILESLAEKVNQIMKYPVQFTKVLIQNQAFQDTTEVSEADGRSSKQ